MEEDKIEKQIVASPKLVSPMGPPANVKAVSEYFRSKNDNYLFRIIPECDPIGRDPGLNIWRANNAKIEATRQLEKAVIEHSDKRKRMDERWDELREKQLIFKDAFVKFNKFICENENKIERATLGVIENEKHIEIKVEEIEQKRKQLDEMTTVCNKMEEQLEKHKIYEEYLQTVVNTHSEFNKPLDIIRRFEALVTSKIELSQEQDRKITELLKTIGTMSTMIENRKSQITGMNNELTKLRIRHDTVKTESKKWDMVLKRLIGETTKCQSNFARCIDGLRLMYENICREKGIPQTCAANDYEGQLIIVMRGIEGIKDIVRKAEEKAIKNLESN